MMLANAAMAAAAMIVTMRMRFSRSSLPIPPSREMGREEHVTTRNPVA